MLLKAIVQLLHTATERSFKQTPFLFTGCCSILVRLMLRTRRQEKRANRV